MGFDERATTAGLRLQSVAQRFRHGFLQLVLAFQALHRDPFAWKRYIRVCTIQSLVTLTIAIASLSTARSSSEGIREDKVRKALENIAAVEAPVPTTTVHPLKAPKRPKRPSSPLAPKAPARSGVPETTPVEPSKPKAEVEDKDDDDDDDDEDAKDAAQDTKAATEAKAAAATEKAKAALEAKKAHDIKRFQEGLVKLQTAITELSEKAGATAVRRDKEFQDSRRSLDDDLEDLESRAAKVPLTEEDKARLVQLGGELDVLEVKTKPGFWDSALALALSIYGALSVVQAVVVALSRDYHAAIARDASLLLGVAPEDPPLVPKVRLNVAWVRRKFKQRTRSLLTFLPGVALISIAALPFPERALVTSVLTSLWATYWWVVWTASKSARAWERERVAPPPWFLRLWHEYVAAVPLVGWVARVWERLWAWCTRSSYSPAEAVEGQPVEFAGLAAARALQLIPLVKLFVRPLAPVAAAHLLAERTVRSAVLVGTPAERATLAAERAAVPASPGAIEARDEM
jgi:hypothetical protein